MNCRTTRKVKTQPGNSLYRCRRLERDARRGDPTQKWNGPYSDLYNSVVQLQATVTNLQNELPIPTSPQSIEQFSQQIPGNANNALALKPTAMPPFFQPADPSWSSRVHTAGRPRYNEPLRCRLATAAVTGVNITGESRMR